MCCFTRPVQSVSTTNIFARDAENGRQFLVYSMNYRAGEDLAMVLPLPVPPGSPEDAVHFIDLKAYPDFFADMKLGFPEPQSRALRSRDNSAGVTAAAAPLAVVQVGSFEASFVPQLSDFTRLDARFRMPDGIWDKLPQYKRSGFAVFKLRKDAETIHPMAFSFPRADRAQLFFPTVHIHDGQVHPTAHFDHSLYCQVGANYKRAAGWRESPQLPSSFMRVPQTQGVVDANAHCYLRQLAGDLKNQDTFV